DGIRDATVTGVQTCALPISLSEFVEANFLNVRHAELFNQVWGEWQRTWDSTLRAMASKQPDEVHAEWGTMKGKLIRKLAGILNQIGRASCRERVENDV